MTTTTTDDLTRHREPSAAIYLAVWIALIVLATVTPRRIARDHRRLGPSPAFAIALTKVVLVVAYFMHLAGGRPVHRIVFSIAMAFLVLLVIVILGDVTTRPIAGPDVNDLGGPP